MDLPPLAPRRAFGGIVAVWVAAAIAGFLQLPAGKQTSDNETSGAFAATTGTTGK